MNNTLFGRELLQGLRARPRTLAPKWFYDAAGSALFDQICELPEYYPTRTELALLDRHAPEIAQLLGPDCEIVEFGAGSNRKVRVLLSAMQGVRRFVPIDISGEHLMQSARQLQADLPGVLVAPVVADFTQPLQLPAAEGRRIGFFPGSSIGNFDPDQARLLLRHFAQVLGRGGLLIGVDLVKDPAVLHTAYNDAQGVTAAFNLNLWARANRELGADFELSQWWHSAFYNAPLQRIEMHLVSRTRQTVRLGGEQVQFDAGDSVHTENSYKYTVPGFQQLARDAGYEPRQVWTDAAARFAIHWLALD